MTIEQDQARRLRELVRESARLHVAEARAPFTVVVAGGCPQVGATTIAERLAAELERRSPPPYIPSENPQIELIDAGAGYTDHNAAHWRDADLALLITTTDRDALLETYATLKFARANLSRVPIYLVVNRCANFEEARVVGNRISESSERFLGLTVPMSGWIPEFHAITFSSDASFAELARFLLSCAETAHAMDAGEAAA